MDFLRIRNAPELISEKTAAIARELLLKSQVMKERNFTAIQVADLRRLFELYDSRFFDGWLEKAIFSSAGAKLTFRLSTSMSRTGGTTVRRRVGLKTGIRAEHFEITIAVRMLFNNFNEAHRSVTVGGLHCEDRLCALQRIMEHEILHLLEQLAWGNTSCSQPRFKSLAFNIFGHRESKHQLITMRELAAVRDGIQIGTRVSFVFDGSVLEGIVNRINRRATVLVESPRGQRYRNGKSYLKYYVPVATLNRVESVANGSSR